MRAIGSVKTLLFTLTCNFHYLGITQLHLSDYSTFSTGCDSLKTVVFHDVVQLKPEPGLSVAGVDVDVAPPLLPRVAADHLQLLQPPHGRHLPLLLVTLPSQPVLLVRV